MYKGEIHMSKIVNDMIDKINEPIVPQLLNSKKYINRELSWLEFNKRVLLQCLRNEVPLKERLNFLGITTSNLDEFIMVRFSSVLSKLNHSDKDISGMNPYEEYKSILKGIFRFKDLQEKTFKVLKKKLNKEDIEICEFKDLDKEEVSYVTRLFYREIYPLLTPMNYDTNKEFPDLKSKDMNIAVLAEDIMTGLQVVSFILLDKSLSKIIKISSNKKTKYILLEDIIYQFINRIYVGKRIVSYGTIKVLRGADVELSHDEDIYVVDRMRNSLKERELSPVIFMDLSDTINDDLRKLLRKIFDLHKSHVYISDKIYDYTILQQMELDEDMSYTKFSPQYPPELLGEHDMFSAIDAGDILLSHPFESYDPIIKLLEHAAHDKDVVAIRQTLYRVSSYDSPVVEALCNAAMNGKQVSIMLEIKARFDEERNISLIEKLKSSGCKIIYGMDNLKTHCKFISIVKKSKKGLKIYSHIGTGNYNDKTAKIYTDISYFTSNFKIGQDIITIFNMLSGFSDPNAKVNRVYFSPYNLRKKLYSCIDNEIKNVKSGKTGFIALKMNSISDEGIINKLYEAASKGVKITVFCRGICSIKPINNNIVIRSIIGRFLEHSRIYYFANNKKPDIFISSADLLTRNLDKRFELMVPIKDENTKTKLLKILSMYYKDTFNSFEMDKKGIFHKVKSDKNVNIHRIFIEEAIENYKLKNIPKMMSKKK